MHDADPAVDAARQMLAQIEQDEDIFRIGMFCYCAACNKHRGATLVLDLQFMSVPILFFAILQDDEPEAAASGGETKVPKAREQMMQAATGMSSFGVKFGTSSVILPSRPQLALLQPNSRFCLEEHHKLSL